MQVQKRNGAFEDVKFDKVTARIQQLSDGLQVSPVLLAQKVLTNIHDGIKTSELDNISADIAITQDHPDYAILASRIIVSNMHKTSVPFYDVMKNLYDTGLLAEWRPASIQKVIVYPHRDYCLDYFGLKTLQKMYLLPGETPQYMFMRVSLAISNWDPVAAQETYDAMSQKYYIHATPTLFNAGTKCQQMSSCFLVAMKDDSIDGIYDTKKECAQISKMSGGIGMHIHNVRAKGSVIRGTNGVSDGILPMLRTFNADARYVNQGGKRKGSYAVYIEPWHADIMSFLDLKLNQGDEEARCRDLFPALWIPDLFMERLERNQDWSLFCPDEARGLSDVYGDDFKQLYEQYEAEGKARKVVPIQKIWLAILKSQVETGTPYMLYKDACNLKSNQKNLGTIKCSNLCTEIVEYTDKDTTAVCNLASIGLPTYVVGDRFDYTKLEEITRLAVRNLNKVIDLNWYPTETSRSSNLKYRPIAIGVQGLADVYAMLMMEFGEGTVNKSIFETIYYAAVSESVKLAKLLGAYEGFHGSPASEGKFQFDLWGVEPTDRYDWETLRDEMVRYGLRNSLLVGPMPTATTSQILGFNECFEPYTSNFYLRRTLAGEFVVVNKHLVSALVELGLWNKDLKDQIIKNNGSVQDIECIPDHLKRVFKTAWEISPRTIIDLAAERGVYVCQSQSMNLFVDNPTNGKLSSIHMYAWKKGLKTGMYYLRTKPKAKAIQFTLDPNKYGKRTNDESCLMCSA